MRRHNFAVSAAGSWRCSRQDLACSVQAQRPQVQHLSLQTKNREHTQFIRISVADKHPVITPGPLCAPVPIELLVVISSAVQLCIACLGYVLAAAAMSFRRPCTAQGSVAGHKPQLTCILLLIPDAAVVWMKAAPYAPPQFCVYVHMASQRPVSRTALPACVPHSRCATMCF